MKLARVIRLDESDDNIFECAGQAGDWAISGAFEFSNWTPDRLSGKARQAFANGWLTLDGFGRATLVGVAPLTEVEYEALVVRLAQHFVDVYGAPDLAAATPVAREEIDQMREMCENQDDNALMVVERELTDTGVHERFRIIGAQAASLDAFAVHGT